MQRYTNCVRIIANLSLWVVLEAKRKIVSRLTLHDHNSIKAYVNGFTNADQHMAKTKSHTSINANNIGTNGGDVVFDNDGNLMDSYTSNTSTVDNGSHVLPDNIGRKDNDSLYLQNKLAKSSRFQARSQLYKTIEISHSTLGRSCLQRAICEVSQTPLIAPNTGLIGQLIDMFLTIDPIHEEYSDDIDDYIEAQAVGVKSYLADKSSRVNIMGTRRRTLSPSFSAKYCAPSFTSQRFGDVVAVGVEGLRAYGVVICGLEYGIARDIAVLDVPAQQ
ncbi:unnamed protein product [Medioppia subpectinata]|uniref:Uncharacterized protein n=1 Tax=Medioppia subpectinata TaxID=1979941 RepID=A0A7R9L3Z6_9ACAR|nr:unnamed protein product [Medioppia subpectinata]CAG2114831.1 unnamed protein product [Medioppia subpectinata]